MRAISLFKDIFKIKKSSSLVSSLVTRDSNNINIGDKSIVNINQRDSNNTYVTNNYFNGGSTVNADNHIIKTRILEIRNIIDEYNFELALKKLQELQNLVTGVQLTINDRYTILINIYICYINLDNYTDEQKSTKNIIKYELCEADEFYKFHYLLAAKLFNENNDDINKILELCENVLSFKPDYHNAKILKTLVQVLYKGHNHNDAIKDLNNIINSFNLEGREKASVFVAQGDIFSNANQYDSAIKCYNKANDVHSLNYCEIGIALTYFRKAVQKAEPCGVIHSTQIDFTSLAKASKRFQIIYDDARKVNNNYILKRIMPYYMNSLVLLDETDLILDLSLHSKQFLDLNKDNMAKLIAHVELRRGKVSDNTMDCLSSSDRERFKIKDLIFSNKHREAKQVLIPIIDEQYSDDETMISLYLISLYKTGDNSFVSEFKRFHNRSKYKLPYELIWIDYLEFIDSIDIAKEKLNALVSAHPKEIVIIHAYAFYERNSFDKDLFNLSTKIVTNEYNVLPIDLPIIMKKHYIILKDKKKYIELEEYYDSIDLALLKPVDKLELEAEYYLLTGEMEKLADKMQEYAKLTNEAKYVVDCASYYMVANRVQKAIKMLEDISDSGSYKASDLHITLAKLYILINDNEKAYMAALKARDIDKDLYKSPSHSFYSLISMRTNKINEAVQHMVEYHENFPKESWVRSVKILKNDDDGSEVIDEEVFKNLLGNGSGLTLMRKSLFEYECGLSTYMHILNGYDLDLIVNELRYKNLLIKISDGNSNNIIEKASIIKDTILVDSLTLYVLADAEVLDILDEIEEVQVSYTTMEFISNMLIKMESKTLRNIVNHISNSINIKLIPIKQVYMKESTYFLDETMHCLMYSKNTKVPYVSIDFNLKRVYKDDSNFVVDIPTIIEALSNRDKILRKKSTTYINSLIKNRYTFIGFKLNNILDTFNELEDYTKLEAKFSSYLCMSRFSEYSSFVNIYIPFLQSIEGKLPEEKYVDFVNMIFDYLDSYIGRTRYYYYVLKKRLDQWSIDSNCLRRDNLGSGIISLIGYIQETIHTNRKAYQIAYKVFQDPLFNRIYDICSWVIQGIFVFFLNYKGDERKMMFYRENFCSRFKYIDTLCVDAAIAEVRQLASVDSEINKQNCKV